jgi:hypothetical protein
MAWSCYTPLEATGQQCGEEQESIMTTSERQFENLQTQIEGLVLDMETSAKKRQSILSRTRNLPTGNLLDIFPLIQEVAELEIGESAEQLNSLREIQSSLISLQASSEEQIQSLHNKANASSKQQNRLNVILTFVSLLIGWSLSLLGNPLTVLHLFIQR